jgi:single-strand DNA-binding protein
MVASFSLATSEGYIDKSGSKQEKTEWHNIVAWRRLAEVAEKYVRKGQQVSIVGKLSYRTWDKPDGSKGYITEIVARDLVLLKNSSGGTSAPRQESLPEMPVGKPAKVGYVEDDFFDAPASKAFPDPEEDLPF